MHFAILPPPGCSLPQNFFASAAQGPSPFLPWAGAFVANPAASRMNAVEIKAFSERHGASLCDGLLGLRRVAAHALEFGRAARS